MAAPAAEKEYEYYEDEPLDYAAAFGKPAAAAPVAPAAPAAAAAPAAVDQYYEDEPLDYQYRTGIIANQCWQSYINSAVDKPSEQQRRIEVFEQTSK